MAEKNRSSVLAVVREVTAGTPVAPTVGTQYVALQEGFQFAPNFDQLDNAEIRASIGVSKSIQGLEKPTASFDHYVRHSGVEGQAPNFGVLIESVLGTTSSNSTERVTAGGSTVSILNAAAGGSDFARGKAVLVKDGTNGYSIRPVDSVLVNALTLGFDLAIAPAAGIGLGKCVNYAPANSGHPTLSLWLYRGNGGAIEMEAGSRGESMSISVAAGELVNASFAFQATKYHYDVIEIKAADVSLDFTDDDGTFVATIPQAFYRDPHDLAQAIQDALNATASTKTYVVVYLDVSGKYKITSNSTVLSLLWNTGANFATTIGDKIGYSTASDDTGNAGAVGYTSDNPITLTNPITPTYDSADPQAAKNNEVFIGDSNDIVCFCASSMDINVTNEIQDVECICAVSGVQDKIFNKRTVEINIVGILEAYDADKFHKFANNSDVKFLFNFGSKSGGNWVAGKTCSIYVPSATVSAHQLGDNNGLVTMEITVKAYVDSSGNGEFYINFL
jgi:hypothetical protein